MANATEVVTFDGAKGFNELIVQFTVPGTNISVDVPIGTTKFSQIYHVSLFNMTPAGTLSGLGINEFGLGEGTVGTATGVLTVTGTALTFVRQTEIGGTAEAMRISALIIGRS